MKKPKDFSVIDVLRIIVEIAWYGLFVLIGAVIFGAFAWGFLLPNPFDSLGGFSLHAEFLSLKYKGLDISSQRPFMIGSMILLAISLLFALAIVSRLRKVFATLHKGKPFDQENARYVRQIGIIVLAGSGLSVLASLILGNISIRTLVIPGAELNANLNFPMGSAFLGLVILALSEVFKVGAKLQRDHDLTV